MATDERDITTETGEYVPLGTVDPELDAADEEGNERVTFGARSVNAEDEDDGPTTPEAIVAEYGYESTNNDRRCFKRNEQNVQCELEAGHGDKGKTGDAVPHVFAKIGGGYEARL